VELCEYAELVQADVVSCSNPSLSSGGWPNISMSVISAPMERKFNTSSRFDCFCLLALKVEFPASLWLT
jgi:hypothetical protein